MAEEDAGRAVDHRPHLVGRYHRDVARQDHLDHRAAADLLGDRRRREEHHPGVAQRRLLRKPG
jgi:hypothetical protein